MQQTSNTGAVNAPAAPRKFDAQFIERQIAVPFDALEHKLGVTGK
ncbi:MAG TPA: transposase, partial [Xanthomonadaceae bacterium]|nr:transposase [Xanthomonadaceae bacterium]